MLVDIRTTPKPGVSIILLNWNGLADTLECLESLTNVTYPNFKTIIVDNASTGDDVKVFKEKFGGFVDIIANDVNVGYSRGYSTGMKKAFAGGAEYVLCLHNDATVAPDFLDKLMNVALKRSEYGILSAVNYSYEEPENIVSGGERARWLGFRSIEVTHLNSSDEVLDCTWVPLSCILMEKKKVDRMGIIPATKEYFLYGDHFWHISALRTKLKIGCVPAAKIWHKGSRSLKRAGWSRLKWILRDNILLRYRFLSPKTIINLTPSQFFFFASWLFIHRAKDFLGLLFLGLSSKIKKNNEIRSEKTVT